MGKQEAFAEYVSARWGAHFRLAKLLVGEFGAEDLTQTALMKAYLAWNRVEAADSPDAYVRRIIVNTAISEGKRRQRAQRDAAESPLDGEPLSIETELVERSAMRARLRKLPPRQRAVIVLRYYEDMSEAEIAKTLNCAPGTVKAHAAAGLRALRADGAITAEHETSGGRHD